MTAGSRAHSVFRQDPFSCALRGSQERLKREKQEAIEKERLRLQQSKAMLEQNAKLEEEARKRAIAQLQREKEVWRILRLRI